jgi:hypothetical protein
MKRKLVAGFLSLSLFAGGAFANHALADVTVHTQNIDVQTIDGWHLLGSSRQSEGLRDLTFKDGEQPFIYHDRLYVPAAVLLRNFGFGATYDQVNETITFYDQTTAPAGSTVKDHMKTEQPASATDQSKPITNPVTPTLRDTNFASGAEEAWQSDPYIIAGLNISGEGVGFMQSMVYAEKSQQEKIDAIAQGTKRSQNDLAYFAAGVDTMPEIKAFYEVAKDLFPAYAKAAATGDEYDLQLANHQHQKVDDAFNKLGDAMKIKYQH